MGKVLCDAMDLSRKLCELGGTWMEDYEIGGNMEELIAEAQEGMAAALTVSQVMDCGIPYLTMQYLADEIKRKIFANLRQRIEMLGNIANKTVLVADAQGIFFAAFMKDGDPVQGTFDRIESIRKAVEHDYFILADDSPKSLRRDTYPEYKGDRDSKPDGFREAKRDMILAAMKEMHVIGHKGYEADDVMSSVAFRCKVRQHKCVIATEDKDLWQCLGKGCVNYSPKKKSYTTENTLWDDLGITPRQVVDWLCMVGKDNTPCLPGVGPKKASALLAEYGDFRSIYDNRENTKHSEAIKEFLDSSKYEIARDLHRLHQNLVINW